MTVAHRHSAAVGVLTSAGSSLIGVALLSIQWAPGWVLHPITPSISPIYCQYMLCALTHLSHPQMSVPTDHSVHTWVPIPSCHITLRSLTDPHLSPDLTVALFPHTGAEDSRSTWNDQSRAAYSSVRARRRKGMSPTTRHNTDSHLQSVPCAAS